MARNALGFRNRDGTDKRRACQWIGPLRTHCAPPNCDGEPTPCPLPAGALLRRSGHSALAAALIVIALGCGSRTVEQDENSSQTTAGAAASDQTPDKPLIFLAAASTKDAVEEVAAAFEAQTGTPVRVSPGPSNALATQIEAGAPADLFLSANEKWAEFVKEKGFVETVAPLLTNGLALIVPRDNPAAVKSPTDLARPRVKRVALAGENVPAGIYAKQALRALAVYELLVKQDKIVRGQDARITLSYVARGEAEAGVVYDTDARIESKVIVVDRFNPNSYGRIVYPLVLVKRDLPNPAAQKLYDFLSSPDAAAIFEKHGFSRLPPRGTP